MTSMLLNNILSIIIWAEIDREERGKVVQEIGHVRNSKKDIKNVTLANQMKKDKDRSIANTNSTSIAMKITHKRSHNNPKMNQLKRKKS